MQRLNRFRHVFFMLRHPLLKRHITDGDCILRRRTAELEYQDQIACVRYALRHIYGMVDIHGAVIRNRQ